MMKALGKTIKMFWLIALIILASGIFFVILDDEDTRTVPQPAATSPVSK